MKTKKKLIGYAGLILPLLLAVICLAAVSFGSHQASLPVPMPQEFIGEYSFDGERWYPLTEDAEISALEGSLVLRGHFRYEIPEGSRFNYYRNHIDVSIDVNGETVHAEGLFRMPDLNARLFASMCAQEWIGITVPAIGTEDTVEIRLYNPHRYGNETAYRDFLNTMCVDAPEWNLLEENLESCGQPFRILGAMLAIAALLLLGAAIAAAVVRVPVGGTLVKLGLFTLCFGGFVVFDTIDTSFWSELNALNTYARQLCMMLAALCFEHFLCDSFSGKNRKIAFGAVMLSGLFNSVLIAMSFTGVTVIFDTLPVWILSQLVLIPLLIVCSVVELCRGGRNRLVLISALVMFAAMLLDVFNIGATIVWRNPFSKITFVVLFVIHVVAASRDVVKNHYAAIRAARLEKELEDSRIAIMLSQIKPHFLYNVLNTIYHLYRKEPETAQEAVSSFAEYLRCNMLSIEKREPIPFSEEYRHIQTYLSLEQIRYRGKLDVIYDVEVTDFKLPPLTVEPLVENAVKHGVTKKRGGGIVTIATRRTETGCTITVSDTGVGFDPENYREDGKPHVGIVNVRERLKSMVGGSLDITSGPDGTAAVITIPAKEDGKTK